MFTSFDVKALFTSVPVLPAIEIVKQRLQQDTTLPQRTNMSIPQITSLLEFCLTNTYFLFQGKYYEQVQGAAMGSPINPLIANIFMEEFEVKALSSMPPPSLWLRFVDDTFVINRTEHSQALLQHINSQDPHIQFTVEPTQQGSLPFLDTLVTIQQDNTFSTSVYRKPNHTDQYLQWDGNHHITTKQSVFDTLAHRAKVVSSTQDQLDKELQLHIKSALQQCQFPDWALNQWHQKFINPNQPNNKNNPNNNNPQDSNNNKKNFTIVVTYMPGTGEKFRKMCKRKGIQVHFKGTNTLRTMLGNSKDKDPKNSQTGIIYHYKCPQINCPSTYIGESGRSLGERVKEPFKAPSPIHLHSTTTGHPMDPEQFSIIHKEVNSQSRTIKETMFIWIQDPTLNRNLSTNYLTSGTTF